MSFGVCRSLRKKRIARSDFDWRRGAWASRLLQIRTPNRRSPYMAKIHQTLWFRFLLLTLLSSMAWAQLPVADDTFIASGSSTNQGSNPSLSVAAPTTSTLVKFDLSPIAGATGSQVAKAT